MSAALYARLSDYRGQVALGYTRTLLSRIGTFQ